MALTTLHPAAVDPTLLEAPAYEIVRLTPQAEAERIKRWTTLVAQYPPPPNANPTTRKVWAALLDSPQPMTSQELALMLGRHRGNIDRALAPLRDAGLIRHPARGLHEVLPKNCRR